MAEQKNYENKMLRTLGMGQTDREAMKTYMDAQPYRFKCWSCKTYHTVLPTETTCPNCGANLRHRDEKSS